MDNITEKFLQESGFQYDERDEQYRMHCYKYLFITVGNYSTNEYYVGLEMHDTTTPLYHISTQQQIKELVKALTGEEI